MRPVAEVEGIEYCSVHGGILVEGSDYEPDGLGCQYPEMESDAECVGVPLFFEVTP